MGQITQAEDVDDSAHGRREQGGQFERPSAALDKQGDEKEGLKHEDVSLGEACEDLSTRVRDKPYGISATVTDSAGDRHNIAGVIGKSKDTFDIEGSPLEKAIYKHQWEHQVFGGRPVPKHIREGKVQFRGFLWRDGMPKHITSVEGVDENGVKFHWDHRRQRSSLPTAFSLPTEPNC